MKRVLILLILTFSIISGCSPLQNPEPPKKNFTEQDVRNAVTELINGINSGNVEVVKKYVNVAGPVTDKLVEKLKNNIKLSNVRDIKIEGTRAQASVTLEVIPLKVNKDITLNFDIKDVLLLDNPLGLLSLLL